MEVWLPLEDTEEALDAVEDQALEEDALLSVLVLLARVSLTFESEGKSVALGPRVLSRSSPLGSSPSETAPPDSSPT